MTNSQRLRIKNYLKISDAAKFLGVSAQTLRRWDEAGKLETIKSPSGYRLYSKRSLEKLLQVENNIKYKREPILTKRVKNHESRVKNQESSTVILSPKDEGSVDSIVAQSTDSSLSLGMTDATTNPYLPQDDITEEMEISGFDLQPPYIATQNEESFGTNTNLENQDSGLVIQDSIKPDPSFINPEFSRISTKDLLEKVNHPDHHPILGNVKQSIPRIQPPIQQVQEIEIMQVISNKATLFTHIKTSFLTFVLFTITSASLIGAFLVSSSFISPENERFSLASLNPFEQKLKDPQDKITKQIATLPEVARNDREGQGQVLQAATSNVLVKIDANTQINGNLTLTDGTNSLTITPNQGTLSFSSGDTTSSITITGETTLNQNLSTTSSPTFSALSLTNGTNQISIAGSILTWSPTAQRTLTLPDATSTLVGIDTTQTLTNKTISGSSNTLSNIANSALSNSTITISNGTGITGGESVSLGGSLTLAVDTSVAVTLTGTQTLTNKTLTSPVITTPTINVGSDATGDIYYRGSDGTFSRLPIGTTNYVLAVVGGVPTWSTVSGSSCSDCVLTDPSATQTITPTAGAAVGMSVAQASGGSVDIFNVTNNDGGTKYFKVDSSGNTTISSTLTLGSGNSSFFTGTGAPDVGLGSNGDYYFRTDGTGGNTSVYYKTGGAWVSAGGGSLQNAYDSGNTITTTTGNNLAVTLASGLASATKFSLTNNHVSNTTDFYLNNANASGTNTNGILVEQTGAGTLTNAINVTQTAGTLTNGINFSGTFTKLINSSAFNVTNAGAITAASLDAGSGTVDGGAFTGTTFNKLTLTAPATSATLTIIDGKVVTVNNTLTFSAGADGQTFTFPSSSGTVTVLGNTTTGSGSTLVLATSPTLVTPVLGVATATSINNVALTAPASSATLTIADGKTFTASNTLTLQGTDSTTFTFPSTTGGTVLTSNAVSQEITSAQTSGTVFALTDSTALDSAIIGASITLSGSGAQDQTGLQFNLSNASGANLNDIVGTGSSWKISRDGVLTVSSCAGCSSFSGTENYLVKFATADSLGDSTIFDNGSIGIGNAAPAALFSVGTNSEFQVNSSGQIILAPSTTTPIANLANSMTAIASGATGSYTTTIMLPTTLTQHSAVTYNGYLFITGGIDTSSNRHSTVYSAPIKSDGTIGTFSTLTYLPQTRSGHSAVVNNGYLFVTGGRDQANATQSTVYSAPINSDGTIGSFSTLTYLPRVLHEHSAVAYNGYLFVTAGHSTVAQSTIYSAPINGDGSIGSFSTLTYLPVARYAHSAVVNSGYLFVTGGNTGSAAHSTVYSAPINSDGTIGSFSTLTYMPQTRYDHSAVTYNGYLLITGGITNVVQSTVYSAPISVNGTIGSFSSLTYLPQVRQGHSAVVNSGYLLITGGTTGSVQSTVYSTPLQSTSLAANTTNSFTQGTLFDLWNNSQSKFSVDYAGLINTSGGINFTNINNKPTAQATSQVDPLGAGGLGSFNSTYYLPQQLVYAGADTYNNYIYITGGNSSAIQSTIYSGEVKADGNFGPINTLSYLPKALYQHGTAVSNGYLFITGGANSVSQSTVYSAQLLQNGGIGTFNTLTYLPGIRNYHGSATYNGYLFAVGGAGASGASQSTVYSAQINGNGTIGAWNTLTYLPGARHYLTSVTYNGYLFAIGGSSNSLFGNAQSTIYSAPIQADGTIGSFSTLTYLPQRLSLVSTSVSNGYLYITGGIDSSSVAQSTIYTTKINQDGTIGTWATLSFLPTARYGQKSAVINGYFFALGGTTGTNQSTVYSAPLQSTGLAYNTANTFTSGNLLDVWNNNTSKFSVDYNGQVNANGGLNISSLNNKPTANIQSAVDGIGAGGIGSWSTNTYLPGARQGQGTVGYNNYLYVTGGSDGITRSSVYSAQVKADGSLGAWNTLSSLPAARYLHGTAIYNGFIFVAGGYNSGGQNTVYSAGINQDGTIGTWRTLSSLPISPYYTSANAANGYLFVIGGYTSASQSTVYSALINGDGTIGSWSTLNYLPSLSVAHASVAHKGYLYVIGGGTAAQGATPKSTVYSAAIKSDGTIGTWNTLSSLPRTLTNNAATVYNDYLYVQGGNDSTNASTIYTAKINPDGTIGGWNISSFLSTPATTANIAVQNGYLFMIGGQNSVYYSTVYSAPLQSTGFAFNTQNTFTNGNLVDVWNNNQSKFSVDYLGGINTQSGINFANINNKPTANLSSNSDPIGAGGTGAYSTVSYLPQALKEHVSVTYNGYLFVTGGQGSARQSTIYSAQVKADGTVGAWNTLTYAPTGLFNHTATTGNGYMFILGGQSNAVQSAVYSAPIRPDGTIGSFSTLTYLPQVLAEPAATAYNGYLFVTGGFSNARQSTVYSAPIRSDGTIGSFSTLTYLPTVLMSHSTEVYNGYLYVIGGNNGGTQSTVYSAPIRSDGTIGSFSTLTYLPQLLAEQSTSIANGYLYVTGGSSSAIQSTVYSAPIRSDGTIGSFSTLTYMPQSLEDHSAIVTNGYLFITGGSTGSVQSTVYSTPLQSTAFALNTANTFNSGNLLDVWNNNQSKFAVDYEGNVTTAGEFTSSVMPQGDGLNGSYSTTVFMPQMLQNQSTAASNNGYLYITGGTDGLDSQSTVYFAQIKNDGTTGIYSTTLYIPEAKNAHGAAVSNNYLFVAGGSNGADVQSTVYSAAINSDGSVDAWVSVAKLPLPLSQLGVTAANGYLFATGGFDGTNRQSTVYSAAIRPDGTTASSYTDTVKIPQALSQHGLTSYNGYLFITGGLNAAGDTAQSTVYSAAINSDGTVGAWATLSSIPQALRYHSSFAYNGYLWVVGGDNAIDGASSRSTVYSAPIKNDGTIGSWSTSPNSLPSKLYTQAATSYNGYIFVAGGNDGTNTKSTVYTAALTTSRAFVFNATNQFPASTGLGGSASLLTLQNNGDAKFNVDASGNGRFAGNIYATGAILGTPGQVGDLAENMTAADESISAADIVSTDGSGNLVKANSAYDANLVGIISTNPSLTFAPEMPNGKPVALSGKVPVKVTTANGEIKPGDYITSSSIPGVGQKATKPGYVIGKALAAFSCQSSALSSQTNTNESDDRRLTTDDCTGTVMVLVNLSFADPGNFLANLASKIALSTEGELSVDSLKTTNVTLVDKIVPSLKDATQSGLLANGSSLSSSVSVVPSNVEGSSSLADSSALPQNDINIGNKLASLTDSLTSYDQRIKDLEDKIASFSAQLADQGKASTSSANINDYSLSEPEASRSAIANNSPISNLQSQIGLTPPSELISSASAQLTLDNLKVTSQATFSGMLASYDAVISSSFKALGSTTLGNTTIAGDVTVDGTLAITGNSINAIGNPSTSLREYSLSEPEANRSATTGILYLQNSPLATGIDLFNGKVTFDKDGNLTTTGSITAKQIKIQPNTSAGNATLKAGETEILVENTFVTENSIILLTPSKSLNHTIAAVEKVAGKSFKIKMSKTENEDITVDYLIIQQEKQ